MRRATNQCDPQTEVVGRTTLRLFRLVVAAFVVAGCVSVVCQKGEESRDVEMWCSDRWWDVMWCGDKCWDAVPATKNATTSTTLYYKVFSVQQSTTKYFSVLQSATP